MKRNHGYGSYRGRSPMRTFLKILAVVLALVLVLGVAAMLYLTDQYRVYSADGVKVVFPWLQQDPAPAESVEVLPAEPSTPVVVVTPEVEPAAVLHAVPLPREALYDGTASAQVEAQGGTAAVFDMKADDGSLGYVSALDLAIEAQVSSGDPAINAAVQALNAGDLYTVARVSCFKDDALPYQRNDLAIKTNSGYNWRDGDDVRWLSPTSAGARDYVKGVCLELAALGFDEILLDNAAYPTQGTLGYIKKGEAYDQTQFAAVVDGFYAGLRAALAEQYPDVKLSVTSTPEALDGTDALSGQTPETLSAHFDRVWVPDLPATAVLSGPDLVAVTKKPGPSTVSWALAE